MTRLVVDEFIEEMASLVTIGESGLRAGVCAQRHGEIEEKISANP